MTRTFIINSLIQKYGYKSYLEIGWGDGDNFEKVQCESKVVVEPFVEHPHITVQAFSDDFFKTNTKMFDIIFIDGCHEKKQVMRDIENSLKFLVEGGTIVCHDMNPIEEWKQAEPNVGNGNGWQTWVALRATRSDLEMYVVETDQGCGVIRRGSQTLIDLHGQELNWKNLCNNRLEWLNLIPTSQFLSSYLGIDEQDRYY